MAVQVFRSHSLLVSEPLLLQTRHRRKRGERVFAAYCKAGSASTSKNLYTRRTWLSSTSLLMFTSQVTCPKETRAIIIDEQVAQEVFQASKTGVVSLADYSVSGQDENIEGVGSGFIWDRKGHIVTNYHCISKLATDKKGSQVTKVEVLRPTGDSEVYVAKLVGYDRGQDLAVLKIEASADELTPVKIGTSADLRVGQSVFAIGNPFGLSHTLTAGTVSGLQRTIPSATGDRIFGAIQTDASISSGNSGGALLDSSGRLVGVNTATFTRRGSGRSSGVNFAVPVDTVAEIIPQIIARSAVL